MVDNGEVVSTVSTNEFDIVLDACDTKSCVYSKLIAKTASDTQPESYSIGVDNVKRFTTFSPFKDTCG